MRILRLLLLIAALVFGQAQACRAVYVCQKAADTSKCCPAKKCARFSEGEPRENCCKLVRCDDHQDAEKAFPQPVSDSILCVLSAPLSLLVTAIVEGRQVRLAWLVAYRSQAPPGETSLRAPPILPA